MNNDASLCNRVIPCMLTVCAFLQVHDSYACCIDELLSTMEKAVEILEATPVGEILNKYLILLYLKVRPISQSPMNSYLAFSSS